MKEEREILQALLNYAHQLKLIAWEEGYNARIKDESLRDGEGFTKNPYKQQA
jgi:hypothetical protein